MMELQCSNLTMVRESMILEMYTLTLKVCLQLIFDLFFVAVTNMYFCGLIVDIICLSFRLITNTHTIK